MPGLGTRLIAYLFVGTLYMAGPLLLVIASSSALHRAAFIHAALRAEGTVLEMRPVRSTRTGAGTCIPVFRFTAQDGRVHVVVSDVSVRPSAFAPGERVGVLFLPGDPQGARIDAFSPLWLPALVPGIVGAAFSSIPLLILGKFLRRGSSARAARPADP